MLDQLVNSPHLKNPKRARQNAFSRTKSSYGPKKPDLRTLHILFKISAVMGSLGLTTLSCDYFTAFRIIKHNYLSRNLVFILYISTASRSLLQQTEVTDVSHHQCHVTQAGVGLVVAPGQHLGSA